MTESQSCPGEAVPRAGVLAGLPAISKSGAPPTCPHCSSAGGGREARLCACPPCASACLIKRYQTSISTPPHATRDPVDPLRPDRTDACAPFRSRPSSKNRITQTRQMLQVHEDRSRGSVCPRGANRNNVLASLQQRSDEGALAMERKQYEPSTTQSVACMQVSRQALA